MPKKFNGQCAEVLLIEDNEGGAVLTEEALLDSKTRISLHAVQDGEEALAFLRREGNYHDAVRPDLILLDLNMPRMDGRKFSRSSSASPPYPRFRLSFSPHPKPSRTFSRATSFRRAVLSPSRLISASFRPLSSS